MRALISSCFLAAGLMSCGDDMTGNMGQQLDQMDSHLTELQSELDTHGRGTSAAGDLVAMGTEEDRHMPAATGHADSMMGMMGQMMQMCRHMSSNKAPDVAGMQSAMQGMRDECSRHRTAMAGMTDMAGARAEESRHATAMAGMMGQMRDMMGGMRGQAGSFHCGSDHHM